VISHLLMCRFYTSSYATYHMKPFISFNQGNWQPKNLKTPYESHVMVVPNGWIKTNYLTWTYTSSYATYHMNHLQVSTKEIWQPKNLKTPWLHIMVVSNSWIKNNYATHTTNNNQNHITSCSSIHKNDYTTQDFK